MTTAAPTALSLELDPPLSALRDAAPRRFSGLRFDLRCSSCGYGVVVHIAPDRCPMCQRGVWEQTRPPILEPARF